jgi:uncharacterized protein involved in outer membrane biogenesis
MKRFTMRFRKRGLLWLLPLALVAVIAITVVALPGFVASGAHRAAIEGLASALTGRQVRIGGRLSLAFTPAPQLVADRITISGPDQETITAKSLTLDIAMPALLQGRLAARALTLQSPVIAFPWPLPGGPLAVAPPRWLTALHAQIADGTISLGGLVFSHVNADIYTGGDGAVTISGTGGFAGQPMQVTVALGAVDNHAVAALTVDATMAGAASVTGHFSGTLNGAGMAAGTLTATATPPGARLPVDLAATIHVGTDQLAAAGIRATQGQATLTGSASLTLAPMTLALDLTGQAVDLDEVAPYRNEVASRPGKLRLHLANATLDGFTIPQIEADASFGPGGTLLNTLTAGLPGNSQLDVTGGADAQGRLAGTASLSTDDLAILAAGFAPRIAVPETWRHASLKTGFHGTLQQLDLDDISGKGATDRLSGSLVLTRQANGVAAAGALHFSSLDLDPLAAWARHFSGLPAWLSADAEITADHAAFGKLDLTHLLLDGSLSDRLVVRRLSAGIGGGLLDASVTLGADGQVSAAQAALTMPSAAPLVAFLPAAFIPPAVLAHAPLSLSLMAAGPPTALATSGAAIWGPITITAAPVLNLVQKTAAGALTIRDPDAIAAASMFGLTSGLAWPGAGSIALRADMVFGPAQIGLPDFVLSAGDLTANGRIIYTAINGQITAQVNADTLALPPLSWSMPVPWPALASLQGRIDLTANRVWFGGQQILGPMAATATLSPSQITAALTRAACANGRLSGALTAALSPTTSPSLHLQMALTGADAAGVALPISFPYTIATGTLAVQADVTANGYNAPAWAASLAGTGRLVAGAGSVSGFTLSGITAALQKPARAPALRAAALAGATNFTSLSVTASLAHGSATLTEAKLAGPEGVATATGSIGIANTDLALTLAVLPPVTPALAIKVTSNGHWASPKQVPALGSGLTWKAASP